MTAVVELEVESSLPCTIMSDTKLTEKNNDVNSDLSLDMKPDDDDDQDEEAHSEPGLKDGTHQEQELNEKGDSSMEVVDEKAEDKELSVQEAKDDDGENEQENVGIQQVTVQTNHLEEEAELESYLESLKPKPKKLSLKERLMLMPGFKDLAAIKPKLGGDDGKNNAVIILDEETNKRVKAKNQKRQQQIELLKERFVRHCIVPPPKSVKGEHVTLK